MTTYVALLRAVNVGGTGVLPMADLRALAERLGFAEVRTYIQSGNLVLRSALPADVVKATLERALAARLGKPVAVMVRHAEELAAIVAGNPYPEAAPARVLVLFVDAPPPAPTAAKLAALEPPGREQLALRGRELFIFFPDGMGASKLKVPLVDVGTGRNLNTVRALLALATAPAIAPATAEAKTKTPPKAEAKTKTKTKTKTKARPKAKASPTA